MSQLSVFKAWVIAKLGITDERGANLEPGWARMLDRYDVEVVMSPRKSVLVQALADRQEWVRVYGDDVAVVYARRTIVAARPNA